MLEYHPLKRQWNYPRSDVNVVSDVSRLSVAGAVLGVGLGLILTPKMATSRSTAGPLSRGSDVTGMSDVIDRRLAVRLPALKVSADVICQTCSQ